MVLLSIQAIFFTAVKFIVSWILLRGYSRSLYIRATFKSGFEFAPTEKREGT